MSMPVYGFLWENFSEAQLLFVGPAPEDHGVQNRLETPAELRAISALDIRHTCFDPRDSGAAVTAFLQAAMNENA